MEGFIGFVLVGGESRRFGALKPLHPVGGTPMAVRVARAIRGAGASRVVFLSSPERAYVGERLSSVTGIGWAVDAPAPCRGPLRALATIALESRVSYVFVAPGDAAWLEPQGVEALLSEATERALPAVPLFGGGAVNPLILASPPRGLEGAVRACWLGGGGRASDALRSAEPGFAAVGTELLGGSLQFHTANTPGELEDPRPPPEASGSVEALGLWQLFESALRLSLERPLDAALYYLSEARGYRELGLDMIASHCRSDAYRVWGRLGLRSAGGWA